MLLGAALSPAAIAQVSLTTMGTAYTQNFDSLASSGTTITWTDNTTLAGWYYTRSPTAATTYTVGTGSSTGGALYSFGVAGTHALTDRALGSVASSSNTYYYGVRFVNNTGAAITSLSVQYTGEEWHLASVAPGKLQFQYQIGNAGTITSINAPTTGWTALTALDFAGPNLTTGSGAVDGNATANRTALSSIINVNIAAGQEIWLRWVDLDDTGGDAGLAIDDLSVTPNNQPFLSVNDVNCVEGDTGTTPCAFTVSIPAAVGSGITFDITTQDGTAIAGTDYTSTTQLGATIPAGGTSYTFNVPVIGNTTIQPNRAFNVQVSNVSGAILQDGTGVGTIQDDDAPSLSINDISLPEGNAGTTTFTFTATLSKTSPTDVTFNVATADGTATTANNDYVALASTPVTILAGNLTATFDVTVNGDTTAEKDEAFTVNATGISSNAKAGKTTGVGTILDDDTQAYSIMDIQGHGGRSPLAGSGSTLGGLIKTPSAGHTNIVTAASSKGFFMQDAVGDNDLTTSDAVFVFTGTGSNPNVHVGDAVTVTGQVQEFSGSTEIAGSPSFAVLSSGNTVPAAYDLSTHLPSTDPNTGICTGAGSTIVPSTDGFQAANFACLDGMLVSMSDGIVNAPSLTSGGDGISTATVSTNGGFFAVAGGPRSFRKPGLVAGDVNAVGHPNIPVFQGDPERIEVFYNGLGTLHSADMPSSDGGVTHGNYNGGQHVTVTGVIQGFTPTGAPAPTYEIYPRTASDLVLGASVTYPVAVATPAPGKLTVGSQNGLHFFNDTADGADTTQYTDNCAGTGSSDTCPTHQEYLNRLSKMSLQIRTVLKAPVVQVMQEVENYSVASDLATQISTDSAGAIVYTPYQLQGNDPGGINIAILVRAGVTVNSVSQLAKPTMTTAGCNPSGTVPCLLNDRPPVLLDATYQGYHFRVLAIYDKSLINLGVNDYVGQKRREQAEQISRIVQVLQSTGATLSGNDVCDDQRDAANTNTNCTISIVGDATVPFVVVGDFNAYEFNDGYVDVTGTIMGTVDTSIRAGDANAANSIYFYPPTPGYVAPTPALFDSGSAANAADHYSYTFNDYLQEIDHILLSSVGHSDFVGVSNAHGNSDVSDASHDVIDPSTARRVSDHDGQVITLGYVVTPSAGANGSISPSTVQTVSSTKPVVFTLTPSSGFAPIVNDNCGPAASSIGTYNSGTGTYTLPVGLQRDCQVNATFTTATYTVSTNVGVGGSVDVASHVVNSGDTATFTFTPDVGHHFFGASDTCGVGGSLDPQTGIYVTGTVTADCVVSATFAIDTFSLNYSVDNASHGSLTGTTSQTVDYGSSGTAVTVTATPPYHFVKWSDNNSTANPRTDTNVTANVNTTAIFAIDSFTVTATAGSHGAITPASQPVASGSTATFTVTPEVGYHVATVSGDTCTVTQTVGNTWTSSAITANCAVTATFKAGYVSVTPARILDTRAGATTVDHLFQGIGAVGDHAQLDLDVIGRGGVANSGVNAVVLNVTATNTTGTGFITVWPTGNARPTASNLNVVPGISVSNLVIVKLGTGGKVSLFNQSGSSDLIADVVGYFTDVSDLTSFTPTRLLETRSGRTTADGQFEGGGALTAHGQLDLTLAGRGTLPAAGTLGAVIMNVTATNTTAEGFVSVWPTGETRPLSSTLNFVANQTIPNLVISKVSAAGQVSLFNSAGSTDLLGDVTGWFPATSGDLTPLSPSRLLETRVGRTTSDGQFQTGAPLPARTIFDLTVVGRGNVPANATGAVILNITVTQPAAAGFFEAWPSGTPRPTVSNVNFAANQTIANLAIVHIGTNGKVSLFNNAATDAIVDIVGYLPNSP